MSENTPTRIEIAKSATIALVETLNSNDWFGVVEFNTDAKSLSNSLLRATQANKDLIIS